MHTKTEEHEIQQRLQNTSMNHVNQMATLKSKRQSDRKII